MMKKVLLIIMSVLLLSGCLIVPAAADEEETDDPTSHLIPAEEYRKILDAAEKSWEKQQEQLQYLKDLRDQNEQDIATYIFGRVDNESKSAILDQSWALYQLGQITKEEYWKMYNFLNDGFGNLNAIKNIYTTGKNMMPGAVGNPGEEVDGYNKLLQDYYSIKNKSNYSKGEATELLLIEAAVGLPSTEAAFKTLLNSETHKIEFDKNAVTKVIKQFLSLMYEAPPSNEDNSEVERQEVLADGGRSFVSDLLNDRINKMYEVLYPFGVIIMLVCWMIGMTKSGLNATFDIKDKDSIARSMINLIIGIGLLALTPWIIEVMTSLGFDLCDKVGIAWRPEIYDKDDSGGVVRWVIDALGIDTVKDKLILVFIQGTLVLNIMRMALMQCLAPLSIGCIAGGDRTKNMSFGWLKEYLKLCLLPGVTAVYICIACAATHTIDNMWINIAVGFSFFLVPKMTMDKLF